jgi:hypothetical protein
MVQTDGQLITDRTIELMVQAVLVTASKYQQSSLPPHTPSIRAKPVQVQQTAEVKKPMDPHNSATPSASAMQQPYLTPGPWSPPYEKSSLILKDLTLQDPCYSPPILGTHKNNTKKYMDKTKEETINFPPNIHDLDTWGKAIIMYGKFLNCTYEKASDNLGYEKWIVQHTNAGSSHSQKDVRAYFIMKHRATEEEKA